MNNSGNLPEIQLTLGEDTGIFKNNEVQNQTVTNFVNPSRQNETDILSEQEKKQVAEFSKKIDLMDTSQILQYGASSQKKISDFSESALSNVITKDMVPVGDVLTSLTVELRGFTKEEPSGNWLTGFFKKAENELDVLRTRYSNAESNITRITDTLETHKIELLKDISTMDKMYEMNFLYYKELTMYIAAGKARLKEALEVEAPALKEKAQTGGLSNDVQLARDFMDRCNRFEKKLHDLELTRSICMQMAPQIRMLQSNDSMIVEKIQSSIINTIPLWKNNMVLSLGLANSQKALNAQKAVTDATNEILKMNADMLKTGTVETAKEAERSIVDIETVKHVSHQLISTIEEVIQIQKDGRQARQNAAAELNNIENELKQKLLEASNT